MHIRRWGVSLTRSGALLAVILIWFGLDFLGMFANLFISIYSFESIPSFQVWTCSWFSPLPYFWLKVIIDILLGGGFVGIGIVGIWGLISSLRDKSLKFKENFLKKAISYLGFAGALVPFVFAYGAITHAAYWLSRQSQVSIQVVPETHQLQVISRLGLLPVSTAIWSSEEIAAIEVGNYRYQRIIKGRASGFQVVRSEVMVHLHSGEAILLAFTEWQIPWYEKSNPPRSMFIRSEVTHFCEELALQLHVPCHNVVDTTSTFRFVSFSLGFYPLSIIGM